jgi:hypothetical protein
MSSQSTDDNVKESELVETRSNSPQQRSPADLAAPTTRVEMPIVSDTPLQPQSPGTSWHDRYEDAVEFLAAAIEFYLTLAKTVISFISVSFLKLSDALLVALGFLISVASFAAVNTLYPLGRLAIGLLNGLRAKIVSFLQVYAPSLLRFYQESLVYFYMSVEFWLRVAKSMRLALINAWSVASSHMPFFRRKQFVWFLVVLMMLSLFGAHMLLSTGSPRALTSTLAMPPKTLPDELKPTLPVQTAAGATILTETVPVPTATPARVVVHLVPFSHWDREWYMGFQRMRRQLVLTLDRIVQMMYDDANMRFFSLDGQSVVAEDYLEMRRGTELGARFAQLIADGRIRPGPLCA